MIHVNRLTKLYGMIHRAVCACTMLAVKPKAVLSWSSGKDSAWALSAARAAGDVDIVALLTTVTAAYDRVFDLPFPYSMGFHQAPGYGRAHPEWHFHAHFYPPLLRSASVRKFMVGFELLGTPQRDITPEMAAERLRLLYGK